MIKIALLLVYVGSHDFKKIWQAWY